MSRSNPGKLASFIVILVLLAAAPVAIRGGLYITNYEGDALHLADIALRMLSGERPHLDFMTPLGALAFWPIVLGLHLGAGLGLAFAIGQTLFALGAGILVWWAAWTRFTPRLAYAFSAACVVLLTSLSHGASSQMIAISMHYNRWAWVLAFVAIVIATLRPRGAPSPIPDGAVIAAAMSGLAFLKATYFVAFAPAILLVLLLRRDVPVLRAAVLWGLLVGASVGVALGRASLEAYVEDLLLVAEGVVRQSPGLGFSDVVVSPDHLVGTLVALAGVAFLRRAGASSEGLALLILLPAFLYVTWQNFGNDPLWLILLAILLFALRPQDVGKAASVKDPGTRVWLSGFAALILSIPLLQNHVLGGLRLLMLDTSRYDLLVEGRHELRDVFMPDLPARLVRARHDYILPGEPYAGSVEGLDAVTPTEFQGTILPACQIMTGIPSVLDTLADDIAETWGPAVLVADLISSHWLFADLAPLPGGAPWTYGSLSGLGAADHVLVPLCPIDTRARSAILDRLDAEGTGLRLVGRSDIALVYRITE